MSPAAEDIVVETHNYIPYLDEFSEGMPGRVLSLAFSPDGKRLASGSQEGFINQWDLASGKKQTMVPRRSVYDTDDRALKVMYSRDGKELVSIHAGKGYAQKWDSETGKGGERFALLGNGRFKSVPWLPPGKGPNRPAIGFENYPVGLYTTKACEEPGMKVASYDGLWEKLPDFDALKPDQQGVIRHIDQEHLSGTTWQLSPRTRMVSAYSTHVLEVDSLISLPLTRRISVMLCFPTGSLPRRRTALISGPLTPLA